tara:strand:- start:11082 stop:12104 length:1023 start_codon:yes stop_codon:yes gene_type:complete
LEAIAGKVMDDIERLKHDHVFGQDATRQGERRTLWVIVITAAMMVVEVVAGIAYGSIALLADGLHMASHAAALGISLFAYIYARKHSRDPRYSFGTGKVNSLGGFTGAVLLALFALLMVYESVERLVHPVEIAFNQAIAVAVIGLIVNALSALILGGGGGDGHGHSHSHSHSHSHGHSHDGDSSDHNLRAAYLHVIADALTSLLAIFALLAAKYYGIIWMDPLMGIIGAILVSRWSIGLMKTTAAVLLDEQTSANKIDAIIKTIESKTSARVTDLHLWQIGPDLYAAELVVLAEHPKSADYYKQFVSAGLNVVHCACEIHQVGEGAEGECSTHNHSYDHS